MLSNSEFMKIMHNTHTKIDNYQTGIRSFMPTTIEIQPTQNCKFRCLHCSYMKRNKGQKSLSKEVIGQLCDDLSTMSEVKCVYISGGGEPLLYDYLEYMVEKIHSSNIKIAIITNGSDIDRLKHIVKYLHYIQVSVFSSNKNLNEKYVGNGQSYLKNLSELKIINCNVKLTGKIVVTKDNQHYVNKTKCDLIKWGFDSVVCKNSFNLENPKKNFESTHEFDFSKNNYSSIDFECWARKLNLNCTIDASGEVYLCVCDVGRKKYSIGNINNGKLSSLFTDQLYNEKNSRIIANCKRRKKVYCRYNAYNNVLNEYFGALNTQDFCFI